MHKQACLGLFLAATFGITGGGGAGTTWPPMTVGGSVASAAAVAADSNFTPTSCTCNLDEDAKSAIIVGASTQDLDNSLVQKLVSALSCRMCSEGTGVWVLPTSSTFHSNFDCFYIRRKTVIFVDRVKLQVAEVDEDGRIVHPFWKCVKCYPERKVPHASVVSGSKASEDEDESDSGSGNRVKPDSQTKAKASSSANTSRGDGANSSVEQQDSVNVGDESLVDELQDSVGQSFKIENGGILIVKENAQILDAIADVRNTVFTRAKKTKEERTNISFSRVFLPLELPATKNLLEVLKKILLQTLFKHTETTEEDLWPCLRDGEDLAENRTGKSGPHILTKPNVLHYLLLLLFLLLLCQALSLSLCLFFSVYLCFSLVRC